MRIHKTKGRGEIIPQSFYKKISRYLIIFFTVSVVAWQIYLYFYTRTFLEFHYSAVLLKLAQMKDEIFFKSIVVSFAFFTVPCLLAAVFLVIYSHRIAGPMFRVKQYLKNISEKANSPDLRFRKKDVLHPLATAINAVRQRERDDLDRLFNNLEKMEETLTDAMDAHAGGHSVSPLLEMVREINTENINILDVVKL